MLHHQTLQKLRAMKLIGMADALEQQLMQPATHDDLSFEERLAMLVDREETHRKNSKTTRLISAAKLKQRALPEDIDYAHPRGLAEVTDRGTAELPVDSTTSQCVDDRIDRMWQNLVSLCLRDAGMPPGFVSALLS